MMPMTVTSFTCDASPIKVTMGKSYTGKCAIGNLEDYLSDHKSFIVDEIANPIHLQPHKINIVIPIYDSGVRVLPAIESILKSDLDEHLELVCFINQPENCPPTALKNNRITLKLLHYIFCVIDAIEVEHEVFEKAYELRKIFCDRKLFIPIIINKTVQHGVGEVLQTSISSYLARIYNYAVRNLIDDLDSDELVIEKSKMIDKINQNTVLVFYDDDIVVENKGLKNIYTAVCQNKVGVGRFNIKKIITTETKDDELIECLRVIMQCWISFKDDLGINYLPPKSATLSHFLHMAPDVDLGTDYDSQKLFAILGKRVGNLHITEVDTVIAERDFPGNSGFVKQLRLFLEGKINDFNQLLFLKNVVNLYNNDQNHVFTNKQINHLVNLISNRKIGEIISFCYQLLKFC
jgi:hypothetical protein